MIQYLVILLDDTSVSFCHYNNSNNERRLMPLDTLKAGIRYAMKENLNVQFVYPDYSLPEEYEETIDSVDHIKIKPSICSDSADVVIFDNVEKLVGVADLSKSVAYILKTDKHSLFDGVEKLLPILYKVERLNIVITDIESFTDDDFNTYKTVLDILAKEIEKVYVEGKTVQLNLLTDRMMLDKMNNCGAGDSCITLAPDGKFYLCPAFYHADDGFAVGELALGLDIKNQQLCRLDYAPLCRNCDAYQCKRCIWLNRKTTLEVNTPSHEQCVVAHLERNASRNLLLAIRKHGTFLSEKEDIREIDYLDPFDVREEW